MKQDYRYLIEESENMINSIVKRKYCVESIGEHSWQDIVNRFKSGMEKDYQEGILKNDISEIIAYRMLQKKFLPAGSVLYGYKNPSNVSLGNCAFKQIESDSLEGIFDYVKNCARMFSWRMGVGTDISILRPKGNTVNNAARTSTGSVSFMPVFSESANTIGQNGRRGASLISQHIFHPDVLYFIDSKAYPEKIFTYDSLNNYLPQVHYANISVKVSDAFMRAVENDEEWQFVFPDIDADRKKYEDEWKGDIDEWVARGGKVKVYGKAKARDILQKVAHSAWKIGDPGLLYWDRCVKYSSTYFDDKIRVRGVNPCGEQTLAEYGVCLLLGVVLYKYVVNPFTQDAYFDFTSFLEDVKYYVQFADYLVDIDRHPFKEQREVELYGRKFGLEILGLADTFSMLGMYYDSDDALEFTQELMRKMHKGIIDTSLNLAKEYGPAPALQDTKQRKAFLNQEYIKFLLDDIYQNSSNTIKNQIIKYGLRNTAFTTIGPTGSLALIADNCSSGIEPVFAFAYERNVKTEEGIKKYNIVHLPLMKYLEETGQLHLLEELSLQELKRRFKYRTVYEIDWYKRIELQGILQRYISDSISSTVNLPENVDEHTIYEIYLEGWKKGLKGITIYRDGSKSNVIKTQDNKDDNSTQSNKSDIPDTGIDILLKDNSQLIIKSTLEEEDSKTFKVIWSQGVSVRLVVTYDNDTPLEIIPIIPPDAGKIQPTEMELIEKKAEWNTMLKLIKLAIERGLPIEEIMYQLNKAKLDENTISDLVIRYIYYHGIHPFLDIDYNRIYEVPEPILQKLNGISFSGKYNKTLFLKRTSGWVAICRFVSILLRADIPVQEIIRILDYSTINMFTAPALISRTLKKFLNNEEEVEELREMYQQGNMDIGEYCPGCGEKALIFIGGCNQCLHCGYSKC